MSTQNKPTQFTTRLGCRDGYLCVIAERRDRPGSNTAGLWYPVREAHETDGVTLEGRPVTETDHKEGIYVDEEGAVFQLAEKGATRPLAVEQSDRQRGNQSLPALASGNGKPISEKHASAPAVQAQPEPTPTRPLMQSRRGGTGVALKARRDPNNSKAAPDPATRTESAQRDRSPSAPTSSGMNLRAKLAEVRRRIGYIQKRGHNERFNYRYVAAADIAGAVGDILAELGVVVIPRLESISYIPMRNSEGQVERAARVIMTYALTDVESGEAVAVKVPGEGLDVGDKATYKAMTGALKYALLQSFLLASGDDPEDERAHPAGTGSQRREVPTAADKITAEQVRELRQLIDETGTEMERVLAYYKVNSLEEMTEALYQRAVEVLNRKVAAQAHSEASHAQG